MLTRLIVSLAFLVPGATAYAQSHCQSSFVSPAVHHVSYHWASARFGLISLALRVAGPGVSATVAQGASSIQGWYRLPTSSGSSYVFSIVETFDAGFGVQTVVTPVYTAVGAAELHGACLQDETVGAGAGRLGDLTVPAGLTLSIADWQDTGSNNVVLTAEGTLSIDGLTLPDGDTEVRGAGSLTLRGFRSKRALFGETDALFKLSESRVDGFVNLSGRALTLEDSLLTHNPSGAGVGVTLRASSRTDISFCEFLGGPVVLEGAQATVRYSVFRRELLLGQSLTTMPEIRNNAFFGVRSVEGGQPGWRLTLPNYFGDTGGPVSTGWLGLQGAQCQLPNNGVFNNVGSDRVCTLPDDRPAPWIRAEGGCGQNVLRGAAGLGSQRVNPRAGRKTLFSFNLMPLAESVPGARYTLQLGGVDYAPVNPGHVARRSHGDLIFPTSPDRTLNFVIPETVAPGTYTAALVADLSSCPGFEAGSSDQWLWDAQVTFDPPFGRPLRILVMDTRVNVPGYLSKTDQGNASNKWPSALSKTIQQVKDDVMTHWPLTENELDVVDGGGWFTEGTTLAQVSGSALAYALAGELETYRQTYNSIHPPVDFIVAVVPVTTLGAGNDGLSLRGYRNVALVDETAPGAALHELGHALGLYTSVVESEQYALPDGADSAGNLIVNGSGACIEGVTAFNGTGRATKAFTGDIAHFPAKWDVKVYDFMGNKDSYWILPSSLEVVYPALRGLLGTPTNSPAPLAPARALRAPQGNARLVKVSGYFLYDQDATSGHWLRWAIRDSVEVTDWTLSDQPTPVDNSYIMLDARLEALDSAGRRLSLQPFQLPQSVYPEPGDIFPFAQVFEAPADTALLKVWNTTAFGQLSELLAIRNITKQATLGGSLTASLGPEGIEVRWQAPTDSLSRPVKTQLLCDRGDGWSPMGSPSFTNRVVVPTNDLAGSVRFGARIANAFESIILGGPVFTFPPRPPLVQLLSPEAGDVGATGRLWQLEAAAFGGGAGAWWSSRDGRLGDGLRLADVRLSAGSHTLSFVASNASLAATSSVAVTVGPVVQANLRLKDSDLTITPRGVDPTQHGGPRRLVPGRESLLGLSVHNPGITNATRVRLLVTPGGQAPLVLIDTNYIPALTEDIRVAADFIPVAATHQITAEVLPLGLADPNPADNTFTWIVTNHPPTAYGARLAVTPGREVPVKLLGYDPELAALSYRILSPPALGQLLGTAPDLRYVAGAQTGLDSFTFAVSDGTWESVPAAIVVRVQPPAAPGPPVFSETAIQGARQGEPLSYVFKTGNDPLEFAAWGLPAGLSLDRARGVISGMPETAGNQSFTILAWNDVGATTQGFSGWFASGAPVVTSIPSAAAVSGQPFQFQLASSPAADAYEVSGLPAGLSVAAATGRITGSTAQNGSYTLGVTASNRWGKGYQLLGLAVVPAALAQDYFNLRRALAAIPATNTASTLQATREVDEPYHAGNSQLQGSVWWTWTATQDGPVWVSTEGSDFDTVLAVYTGSDYRSLTPVASSDNYRWDITSSVMFQARGGTTYQIAVDGAARGAVRLAIAPHPQPLIANAVSHRAIATQPFTLAIEAENQPTRYGAQGLPQGLTLNAITGVISGAPAAKGGGWVTLTATNAFGYDSLKIYLEVMSAQYPVFTCPVHAAADYGQPFEFDATATHATGGYRAWPLPSGLSIHPTTGRISGTPWGAGVHRVTVDAGNAAGELAVFNLVINVRLPYALWSQNYILPPARQGPNDDADGDGMTNDQERMAGTNPQDPQDLLEAGFLRQNEAWVLTWKSVPGFFYRPQSAAQLEGGAWTNRAEIEAAAANCSLPLGPQPARFWRVLLVP